MNWTKLLKAETESAYAITEKLVAMVDEDALSWKPATGSNWMTTGQLLKHLTESCGGSFRAFIKGDWGLPEGVDIKDISPESMIPPAEAFPAQQRERGEKAKLPLRETVRTAANPSYPSRSSWAASTA
jgi:hypothetical protein